MTVVKIPQSIKDNILWALLVGISFLFMFYVKSSVVMADEHKVYVEKHAEDHKREMSELEMFIIKDRITQQIYTARNEMARLRTYNGVDPEGKLSPAREQRVIDLEMLIENKKQELEQLDQ